MSFEKITYQDQKGWTVKEKGILRFFTLFFVLAIFPIDKVFFSTLFSLNFFEVKINEVVQLISYYPRLILDGSEFGFYSYLDFLIVVVIALIGTSFWSYLKFDNLNYDKLYYWLRVFVRYRLALILIAYGFIKVFTLQIPYPSLSNLHTNYGDFLPWKIYLHTVGIVPGYEASLGAVEIFAGLLLLHRRTVVFGAGIILGFIGNVFMANVAYQIGDHIFTFYILIFASFLFAYDAQRLFDLLYLQKKAVANKFKPVFSSRTVQLRIFGKALAALSIFVIGGLSYIDYKNHPYLIPDKPGLKDAYGFYNVREFVFNNDTIPYSIDYPHRWQNVVFEKWATLSIKIARPVKVDFSLVKNIAGDSAFNFESAGVSDRHYFAYQTDTIKQSLVAVNKNKNHKDEQYSLTFKRPDNATIILRGKDQSGNSIYAVLEKIDRKYMLFEGRRRPAKL